MPENGQRNIIDRIDELTDDAATWSTNGDGDGERPWWTKTAPGSLAAVGLGTDGVELVEISETDPAADIVRYVGDQEVVQICGLRRVRFWIGADSAVTSEPNRGATEFLHNLFADIRDGDYIASDEERAHVRSLFDTDTLPVIHGPCLITGVNESGDAASLTDNFEAWFTALLADKAPQPRDVIDRVLVALGIPPEELGDVVVVLI